MELVCDSRIFEIRLKRLRSKNKKSPRGIRPRRCSSPPPGGCKVCYGHSLGCVAKDTTSISLAERKPEVWGKWPPQKKHNHEKKMGITRPRPDGGVIIFSPFLAISASLERNISPLGPLYLGNDRWRRLGTTAIKLASKLTENDWDWKQTALVDSQDFL